MNEIYVIGHKNPDTDAIGSAIAYADFKKRLGQNVKAGRLGPLNEETKYAFKRFGIEEYPEYMSDARCRLVDIDLDKALEIDGNTSCNETYERIVQVSTKTVFVTEDHKLKGIVSISDLFSIKLMTSEERNNLLSKSNIELVSKDVKGQILSTGNKAMGDGRVHVYGGYIKPGEIKNGIAVLDNELLLLNCLKEEPAVVIFNGESIDDIIVNAYKDKGIALIMTKMHLEDVIRIINDAIPVSLIMTTDFSFCKHDDHIDEIVSKINSTRFRSYPVLDDEGRIIGSISRYHLFKYEKKKFILVDHSSTIQTIDNIDQAVIEEIVDHHHIGDIQTNTPINYRNQVRGATCSIIYSMYKEYNFVPDRQVAGIMLSAIISDTLFFKSKTTTDIDIQNAKELAVIAGVDIEEYAPKLLSASVNLIEADPNELISRDMKQYSLNGYNVAISQTNYDAISDIQSRLEDFKNTVNSLQKNKNFDLLIMMFTNVRAEGSMFLFAGPKSSSMFEIIETKFDEHSGFDKKIISRKQQLVPKLSQVLEEY